MNDTAICSTMRDLLSYRHSNVVHLGDASSGKTICGVESWGIADVLPSIPISKKLCWNCAWITRRKKEPNAT